MKGSIDSHLEHSLGVPAMVYPYRAGVVGGLLGGLAMVVVAIVYGLLSGRGIWYPVNLIAAPLVPELQSASPEQFMQFHPTALLFGLGIHFIISATLGLVFAMLLPTLPGRPVIWAVIVGPLLWLAATFVTLPLINPYMEQLVDWPSFAVAHVLYSLILGAWVMRTPKVPAHGPPPPA